MSHDSRSTTTPRAARFRGVAALLSALAVAGCAAPTQPSPPYPTPTFDSAFWDHWGDGKAELSGFDLVYPRYGAPRKGRAVTIFVTETFDNAQRVKDEGRTPHPDTFPVMKLNLVQDFQTGIYDYNLMTSTFVALTAVNGRPAGEPTKIAFSSQEWCGQVYEEVLFDARDLRFASHSYFDGEADKTGRLEYPAGGLAGDALLLWARGLAGPLLAPGEHRKVPLLRSLERVRLEHVPLVWDEVTLSREAAPEQVTVPAGEFEVDRYEAATTGEAGAVLWTFLVERAAPHRLVRWSNDAGLSAELRGSARLAYWKLNGPGQERFLADLGF